MRRLHEDVTVSGAKEAFSGHEAILHRSDTTFAAADMNRVDVALS